MDDYLIHNIALKTLKQRCEYLQQRLNAVEEENCRLKLEKAQDMNCKTHRESTSQEERLIMLSEEKSQIAHRLQLIANENFALWSILSKVAPDCNLSSLRFSVSGVSDDQVLKISQIDNTLNDYCKETVEELSLRLINGIIVGKKELDSQYSQMIELQKENIVEDSSSFLLKQIDSKGVVKNLEDFIHKLKDFKEILFKQKYELSNAIALVKNLPAHGRQRDISSCDHSFNKGNNTNQSNCEFSTYQDFATLVNEDEKLNSKHMICPMCGKSFNELFITFFQHVSEHFEDETDDFVDARANFDGV